MYTLHLSAYKIAYLCNLAYKSIIAIVYTFSNMHSFARIQRPCVSTKYIEYKRGYVPSLSHKQQRNMVDIDGSRIPERRSMKNQYTMLD